MPASVLPLQGTYDAVVCRSATGGLPLVLDGGFSPTTLPPVANSCPPEARSTVSRKLAVASSCWEQAHVSLSTGIQAEEASEWRHMSQVHAVTLTALRRTTLSDPRRDIRGATAQRMKRLRDEIPPETHKKRRTEAPEVPSDLQDMEIPLEDMGDVIVLTGL